MMVSIKRFLVYILAVSLAISQPVTTLADTLPGGTHGGSTHRPGPSNPGYKPDYSSFMEYGYRVTITDPQPIIGGSGGNPTFATYKNWGFRITMAPI